MGSGLRRGGYLTWALMEMIGGRRYHLCGCTYTWLCEDEMIMSTGNDQGEGITYHYHYPTHKPFPMVFDGRCNQYIPE